MKGHVYHWKHGWIPLDHVAAISKAKGSHKGAEKIMAKHGIEVPHHEHGPGDGGDLHPDTFEKLTGRPAPSREADARRIGSYRRSTTEALRREAAGPFGKEAQAELDRRAKAPKGNDLHPDTFEKLTGRPAPSREADARTAESYARSTTQALRREAAGGGKGAQAELDRRAAGDALRAADAKRTKPLSSTTNARFGDRSALRQMDDAKLASVISKLRPGSEAHTAALREQERRGKAKFSSARPKTALTESEKKPTVVRGTFAHGPNSRSSSNPRRPMGR